VFDVVIFTFITTEDHLNGYWSNELKGLIGNPVPLPVKLSMNNFVALIEILFEMPPRITDHFASAFIDCSFDPAIGQQQWLKMSVLF
jgi:hypothetical protein